MEIYLKHPVHGVKIATLEAEAKFDESKGWTRFDPKAPDVPEPGMATIRAELTTITPLKRKPGRPRKAIQ